MNDFRFFPQVVIWEITFACNMRCIHCGTSAGKARPAELSTEQALGLIDELHALGCESITLSGGEPLLRGDWPQLATRIVERGMLAYLITNGYLVDEPIVERMRQLGLSNVGVSIDGMEATHNHIRQNPRGFERAVRALRLLRDGGVRFCALTQVSNINLRELDELRALLVEERCPVWRIQMTTSTGRMPRDMVLSLEKYPQLVDKVLEFQKRGELVVDVGENIGYYGCKGTELMHGMPYLGCYAGLRVAGIESDGNVKGCLSMPETFVEGNVRERGFTAIWNDPNAFAYNRRFTRETADGQCRECRYLPLCRGGCTTTSISASGHRADNPYCTYRMEGGQRAPQQDSELVAELLSQFAKPQ